MLEFLYIELSPLSSSFNKSLFCENYHNKEIPRTDILRSKWYCIGLQINLDLVAVSAIHILTKFTDNSIRTGPHSFSKDMIVLASWCCDVFTAHSKVFWIKKCVSLVTCIGDIDSIRQSKVSSCSLLRYSVCSMSYGRNRLLITRFDYVNNTDI